MSEVGQAGSCSRNHPWCVSEETQMSADGSPARFHLGARTVVPGGDDAVACLIVASEDVQSEPYVEVVVVSDDRRCRSVWLSPTEAAVLGTEISASAGIAAKHSGSGCSSIGFTDW